MNWYLVLGSTEPSEDTGSFAWTGAAASEDHAVTRWIEAAWAETGLTPEEIEAAREEGNEPCVGRVFVSHSPIEEA